MKKMMALVLSLLLLGSVAAIAEEEITVEITFEGEWIPFEGYNFELYLPADWGTYVGEDDYEFFVGNEDGSQRLMIDVLDADGYTLEDMLLDLSIAEECEGAAIYTINDIDFVLFSLPEQSAMGAITTLSDEDGMLMFVFLSEDPAFEELATQIMASIRIV